MQDAAPVKGLCEMMFERLSEWIDAFISDMEEAEELDSSTSQPPVGSTSPSRTSEHAHRFACGAVPPHGLWPCSCMLKRKTSARLISWLLAYGRACLACLQACSWLAALDSFHLLQTIAHACCCHAALIDCPLALYTHTHTGTSRHLWCRPSESGARANGGVSPGFRTPPWSSPSRRSSAGGTSPRGHTSPSPHSMPPTPDRVRGLHRCCTGAHAAAVRPPSCICALAVCLPGCERLLTQWHMARSGLRLGC